MSRLLPGAAGLVVPTCILTKMHRIQVQNGFDTLILDATPLLSILHAPNPYALQAAHRSRTQTPRKPTHLYSPSLLTKLFA